MMERLRAYYSDSGVAADVFDAVLALQPAQPHDFDRRVRAVTHFQTLAEAQSLAAANKRVSNILKQAGVKQLKAIDNKLLREPAEQTLAQGLADMTTEVTPLLKTLDYENALSALAKLREPVDRFFDDVMVMVDDKALRDNRLAILAQMRDLFLRTADLSRLHG